MRMFLLLFLVGCSPELAPPVDPAALARWSPSIALPQTVSAVDGVPLTLDVPIAQNGRTVDVVLIRADAAGLGPCAPGGAPCLGVQAPVDVVARATGVGGARLTWTPSLADGADQVLQAAILFRGRPVAVSNVATLEVAAAVPGCTDAGFSEFDPAANADDGTCFCPKELFATSAAELAPYLGCSSFDVLQISGDQEDALTLPALRTVGELLVSSDAVALDLPVLAEVDTVHVVRNPVLERVRLPALVGGGGISVRENAMLTDIELSVGDHLGFLTVQENAGLTTLRVPDLSPGPADMSDVYVAGNASLTALSVAATGGASANMVHLNPMLSSLAFDRLADGSSLILEDLPELTAIPTGLPVRDGYLFFQRLMRVSSVDLTGVETALHVELTELPILSSFRADGLTAVTEELIVFQNRMLQEVRLPVLTSISVLDVGLNDVLTVLDLSSLGDSDWTAFVLGNPLLCASGVPILAAKPPGCTADLRGNACN